MLIHNAQITGSLTLNGIDIGDITGSEVSIGALNSFSSSINIYTGSNNTNINALQTFSSSILTYTASNDSINTTQNNRLSSLETTSGSLINASSSFSTRVSSLESFSSSLDSTFATDAELTSLSSSVAGRLTTDENTITNNSSSFASRLTTDETNISNLQTASGSFSTRVTNTENTITNNSSSFASRLTTDENNISSLQTASGSFSTRVTSNESNITSLNSKTGSYATTESNTFVNTQYISAANNSFSFTSTASLYTDGGVRVTKDLYVSGTSYFNNVTIYGTQSVQYITSSQLNIGTNIINVNTDTPSIRFGGLAVYDSGSTGLTGSMLWDSQNNHWVYSNPSGSTYSGGMFISGPRTATLGSEQGTTSCMLLAGQGGDHLTSSMIYHSSTATCIPNTLAGGVACFSGQVCGNGATFAGCVSIGTSAQCSTFVVKGAFSGGYYPSTATKVPLANFVGDNPEVLISDYSNAVGRTATLRLGTTDVDYYCYGAFVRAIQGSGVDSYSLSFGTSQNNPATTKLNINGAGVACFASNVCVGGGLVVQQASTFGNTVGLFGVSPQLYIGATSGASDYVILGWCSTNKSLNIRNQSVGNSSQLVIACEGNIGIGTLNPIYKLDVSSDINDGSIIRAINLNSGAAATARVYVENNIGSLGQLTTYSSGFGFNVFDIAAGNFTALLSSGVSSAGLLAGTLTSDPMIFGTNNIERMRITCDGNIGIGTTDTQTFRLAVNGPNVGQGDTSTTIRVFDTACATTGTGGGISFAGYFSGTSSIINTFSYIKGGKENSTAGDYASYLSFGTRINGGGATERMRITSGGIACFACQVCAPSFRGGSITGTSVTVATDCSGVIVDVASRHGLMKYFNYSTGFIGACSGTDGSISTWLGRFAGSITSPTAVYQDLIMYTSGIASFACQVCSPILVAGSVLAIQGNCSASICFYKDYSGSPGNPGMVIYNTNGTLTFQHNANGGTTSMQGNVRINGVGNQLTFDTTDGSNTIELGTVGDYVFRLRNYRGVGTIMDLGNNHIDFYSNGSLRQRIFDYGVTCFACQICAPAAIFTGCVGIGITSPTTKLDVYAGVCTSAIIWGQTIRNEGNAATTGYGIGLKLKISGDSVPNELYKWAGITAVAGTDYSNRTDLAFYTNAASVAHATEKIRITGDGNLGINTTAPNYKLEVNGNSCFAGSVAIGGTYCAFALNVHGVTYQIGGSTWVQNGYGYVNAGAVSTGLFPLSDNTIQLRINNSAALTIDSEQKVGLGTTTPCTRFHSEGGYGATWGGNSCFFGGGVSGGGFPYGDIYGNGASYTYQVACTNQTNGSLRGGFAAGYFKGGPGSSYGGGGAGVLAIGGDGANAEGVNSGGGAGLFARGGKNGAGSAHAYAGWFDGGNVVIRCGNFGINNTNPTALFEAGIVSENTTAGGFLFNTIAVSDSNWFCFYQPTANWAGLMTMHWVAPNDHNRSGAAQIRWSYQACSSALGPTTSIFNDSQNATATFRYAGGWLQACITGAGAGYSVQFTILGARGA